MISPELVLEVEARMKRNYLPPSIQGAQYQPQNVYHGYQGTQNSQTQNAQSQTHQGSITAGTPTYQSTGTVPSTREQKQTKMTLETIPQGSVMGSQFSSPTQAVSPFTPSIGQFSPTHGSVVNQNIASGSITSGTPILSTQSTQSGSIMSGTPISTTASTFNTSVFGSISSGTPKSQNFTGSLPNQLQGSIMSGTPVVTQHQQYPNTQNSYTPPMPNQGSIMSGTPVVSQNQPFQSNQNHFQSGQNQFQSNQNQFHGNQNQFQGVQNQFQGTQNSFPSVTNQGSITSGYAMPAQNQQYQIQGAQNQYPNSGQYTPRPQRKYSGPQRVKLQMLATVQEMGNLCFFFILILFFLCTVVAIFGIKKLLIRKNGLLNFNRVFFFLLK